MTVSDRGRSPSFVINENILGKWFRGSSSSNKFKNLRNRNRVNLENYDQQQQVPHRSNKHKKKPPIRRKTQNQHLQDSDRNLAKKKTEQIAKI